MKRITLTKTTGLFVTIWKYQTAELCVNQLPEFIEIPPGTEKIDAVFYTRPGKNRMKVTLPAEKGSEVTIDGESVTLYCSADDFLFHHFKKNQTFYVEFEY